MTWLKDLYMYLLATVLILGFIVLLIFLVLNGVPPANSELLYIAIGAFVTMVGTMVNYFFGSSKGSKDKTDIMANGK